MSKQAEILAQAESLVKQGRFDKALSQLQRLSEHNRQSLYLKAVCFRYQERFQEALATLNQLFELAADYGRGYQEAGHCYAAIGQWQPAMDNYLKAVGYNPALLASWQKLGLIAKARKDEPLLTQVKNHMGYFAELPDVLISVTSMLHEGKLYKAESVCRHFLQNNKHHPEAMRLLAKIATELQILDDAEFLLESVLEFVPTHQVARFDYIGVLHKKQRFDEAFEQAKRLLGEDPNNPSYQNSYANQCAAVGKFDEAITLYRQVEEHLPDAEAVALSRGHAHKAIGEQQQAIDAYLKAANEREDFGDAYWSLANLKTYHFSSKQTERMQELEAKRTLTTVDRIHLCFALGKAFEDAKNYDESFRYYHKGNELKARTLDYSQNRMTDSFEAQKRFFAPQEATLVPPSDCLDPAPIFIVGLPRAGSTLIEQILASHSQIDGTMELQHIMAMAHRLDGRRNKEQAGRYPQILSELSTTELGDLGRQFIAQTRYHRGDAKFFTDKMPNNFRHIGLIKSILPNAKIIDARRDALSCCFSGYKQLFAEGQEFSYRLEDIAHYYRGYVDLMDHWHQVFPGEILRVDYADVVANVGSQVARLLEFIGVDFEQQCVDYHSTRRSVRTASSEQVRRPIYRSGLAPWKPFATHLAPLIESLGPLAAID